MNRNLSNGGNQCHQYKQNDQSPVILTELTEHKKDVGNPDHGLVQAGTHMWWDLTG